MNSDYDNPWWEYHLPVNPPGAFLSDDDVELDSVSVLNWTDPRRPAFRPRLRDKIQQSGGIQLDEDEEYDCD